MRRYAFFSCAIALLLSLVILAVSCSPSKDKASSDEVVLQLNWTDDATFTGEYVAKDKFWFLNKLNVTIKQGGVGIDPIAMVISKKADFAVVGADKAMIAIADGKPICIVSVDLQRNPVGWIVRQSLRVLNFEDMRNRKNIVLGDKAGTEVSAILDLVLKRKGLGIAPRPVSFDFSYFLATENVVYPVYLNEEPMRATIIHKIKINEIDPSLEVNGGVKLYGNVIITHSDKVEKYANQVDNFVRGIKSGWEFAKNNRDQALSILMKYVKADTNYVRETMNRTIEFATNMYDQPVPAGHMEYTAWEKSLQTVVPP